MDNRMQIISGEGVPGSHLPFSPAVVAGGLVYVSGQASVDGEGKLVPGDIGEEVRRSFDNVKRVLAAAGVGLSQVVQVRSYVRDAADLPGYNRVYAEVLGEHRPARTTLTGCLPESMRFEVDVVALAPPGA